MKDQKFYSPVSVAYIIYSISRLELQPIHDNSIQYKAVYSRFIEIKRNLNRTNQGSIFLRGSSNNRDNVSPNPIWKRKIVSAS